MSYLKNKVDEIINCNLCNGLGYEGWANGEDWDIEWCDCNPEHIILDEMIEELC